LPSAPGRLPARGVDLSGQAGAPNAQYQKLGQRDGMELIWGIRRHESSSFLMKE
jgi:hypothetical protein